MNGKTFDESLMILCESLLGTTLYIDDYFYFNFPYIWKWEVGSGKLEMGSEFI